MSLGGGGSGGTQQRNEIIKSEREQLQEIERRMNVYDALFSDVEKGLINESYKILNTDRLKPFDDEIAKQSDLAQDADKKLADLTASVVKSTKNREEINAILNSKRNLKAAEEARTAEIRTQQGNSKLEQTEQDKARANATVDNAFAMTEQTRDLRDERFGVDPTANGRSAEEQRKELALIKAAAEAGARNKAKTDIDALAKAKMGALVGGDLVDRAAGDRLNALGNTYLSQSAAYADQAEQYNAQKNAATMQIINGVGGIAGAIGGTVYTKTTPKLTNSEKLGAINLGRSVGK